MTDNKNDSQSKAILTYLKSGKRLTALEAIPRFECMRLAARIHELREFHPIEKRMIELYNGKRVAQYYYEFKS